MIEELDYNKIGELVKRAKADDYEAFGELYRLLAKKMYCFALSICKDTYMAEEVVQNSFMAALKNINQIKNNKIFLAWMNKIVYRNCLRLISQNNNKSQNIDFEEEEIDCCNDSDPFVVTAINEQNKIVLEEIQKLPVPMRAAIYMHYYEGMKLKDIGNVLNIPIGTVKSRLNKAKKVLNHQLNLRIGV